MTIPLRFDFPPEVVAERIRIYEQIFDLLQQPAPEAFQEAKRLHITWLTRYPGDIVALDAGEVIAMSEDDTTFESNSTDGSEPIAQQTGTLQETV